MRYGSVCSGIEAAGVAWKHLGWTCAFVSETGRFQSKLLSIRWPGVPNLGDFTKIGRGDYDGDVDLLVGGTPCQTYSRAGRREGLGDPRGGLALGFAELALRLSARWLVWENVVGVLSSTGGRDFAVLLSRLAGWDVRVPDGGWRNAGIVTGMPGGFSVGWRVLDARYARVDQFPRAVPQRRRRLVLVGNSGGWERVRAVLFDGEMCGGLAPPRHAGSGLSAAGDSGGGCCYPVDLTNLDGRSGVLPGKCWDGDGTAAYTITRRRPSAVCAGGVLRMLTPLECERAFGLPDGYTAIPWHGRDAAHCPDWSRYRAIGNSMPVNVMAWIGERIDEVERHGAIEDRGGGGEAPPAAEGR